MRVGLNLLYLRPDSGGTGRYAVELIPALLEEDPALKITVFVTRAAPSDLQRSQWAGSVRWVCPPIGHGAIPWHLLYAQVNLPAHARARLDVVHGPANTIPLVTPGVRRVMTLHDLAWVHHPDIEPNPARRAMMHTLAVSGARRAHRVITSSAASRDDLVATGGLDPASIDVIPLGVRLDDHAEKTPERALRETHGLGSRRIVLCVAQVRPHKNLEQLVRAAAVLRHDDAVVVIVGAPTRRTDALKALAEELGVSERVRLTGWVSDADLEGLYAAADCFVSPSTHEGFGLTIGEAMGRGVPVACSDIPVLREVAGTAALLFEPADPGAIAERVDRLLADPALAAQLAARGHDRAAALSWQSTARGTLESYRRAQNGAASRG